MRRVRLISRGQRPKPLSRPTTLAQATPCTGPPPRCAPGTRPAQLDLRQNKKISARNSRPGLISQFLLRAARGYSATPPGPTEALFLNRIVFSSLAAWLLGVRLDPSSNT